MPAWIRETYDRKLGLNRALDCASEMTETRRLLLQRTGDLQHTRDDLLHVLSSLGERVPYGEFIAGLRIYRPNIIATSLQGTGWLPMDIALNFLPPEYADNHEQPEPMYVKVP